MKNVLQILLAITVAVAAACESRSTSGDELVLPEGDVERGQVLFVEYRCTGCHVVQGLEMPEPEAERPFEHTIGSKRKVKTYAELVTAVVNPTHRTAPRFQARTDGSMEESPMTVYNDVMSVTDLIDLVAFLETRYELQSVRRYRYVPYKESE